MTQTSGSAGDGRFAACVAVKWPAVLQRLGDRRPAFESAVQQRARAHGLVEPADEARYLNLCFAFGPGFEDKTENEWALALLVDQQLRPEVKLHQLVLRAERELQRRRGDELALRGADNAVLDLVDVERQARDPAAHGVPRKACDIEAIELRLIDNAWRQEYQGEGGQWLRVPAAPVAPLRIGAAQPAPPVVTVLTMTPGETDTARLQVRQVSHGHCGLGLHPALHWLGNHGIASWREHEARSIAWPLRARPDTQPPRLLAETAPEVTLLQVPSCGLRDEGVPLQEVKLQLWAYAAWQWLFTLEREARLGFELPDPKSAPPAVVPTKCRIERDGAVRPAQPWQQGFDQDLREKLAQGLQRLLDAWQPNVQHPKLRADVSLFDGRAALTWGWREGPHGLAGAPIQRAVGEFDLTAHLELFLGGQVEYAGARAQLRLRVEGEARLQSRVERLHAEPPLLQAMAATVLRWRWPVTLEFDPLADDSGIVFSEAGPCTGAVVGSLGLRPSAMVGGAWEWFATMSLEPVATRVVVHDPLLGRSESHMALLGSIPLLDWSLV